MQYIVHERLIGLESELEHMLSVFANLEDIKYCYGKKIRQHFQPSRRERISRKHLHKSHIKQKILYPDYISIRTNY